MSLWKICRLGLLQTRQILTPLSIARKPYSSDLYEPDYLQYMIPEIPEYDSLNIQLKGYDFVILENFQKFVHRAADTLELDIDEGWATPPKKLKVQRYKSLSTAVDEEYQLTVYERNVQVSDVPSNKLPILLRIIQTAIPEGVSLQVHEATEEQQEIRYVPDNELLTLKQQLDEMGGPRENKSKAKY